MNSNIVPNSFVAISDFHSTKYLLDKVTKNYINEYDKIFILGDVTSRGENFQGKAKIEFLENIKKLCEQYPSRIIYIPCIDDNILYSYSKDYSKDSDLFDFLSQHNTTIKYLKNLMQNDSDRVNSMITWLGNLPLQRVHEFDGQKFVFASAFFNQTLYEKNPNYSLKDLLRVPLYRDKEARRTYDALDKVLHFDSFEYYSSNDVPSGVIEVIGYNYGSKHLSFDLNNNSGGTTKVFSADEGITFGNGKLKYDGEDYTFRTSSYRHKDTLPKMGEKVKKVYNQKDLQVLIDGIKETANKHGMKNIKNILMSILQRDSKWYMYFSRGNRDKIEGIGIDGIIQLINNYSNNCSGDFKAIVNDFFNRLYEEDTEFKEIVENEKKSMYSEVSYINDEMDKTKDYSMGFASISSYSVPTVSKTTSDVTSTKDENNTTYQVIEAKVDYKIIKNGDELFIVGNIAENQIFSLFNKLSAKYGSEVASRIKILDYSYAESVTQNKIGQAILLDEFGCTVIKNDDGTIEVTDISGNVIFVFSGGSVFGAASNGSIRRK